MGIDKMIASLELLEAAAQLVKSAPVRGSLLKPRSSLKSRIIAVGGEDLHENLLACKRACELQDAYTLTALAHEWLRALRGAKTIDSVVGSDIDPAWSEEFRTALIAYRSLKDQ